ncbi:hypothetical protein G6011_04468 [Alternaria panax]|uniref:Uncharacterized protein n=1 Tax=Alternaria panax TaxID=48097 RepID=A0AAD4IGL0_9PLEO|nr:hypothetical protein G6011_04468 [Alternaria panax]
MEKWFKKYYKAAKKNTWDDDIWGIWQREHGLKIADEAAKRKEREAGEKGRKEKLVHGFKKAGVLFGKFAMTLDSDEQRLRQEEAGKEEERRCKLAGEQLVAMSVELADDPFVNPPAERRENVEEGDFKSGSLRGDGDVDGKETPVVRTSVSNTVALTRHSWLLGC